MSEMQPYLNITKTPVFVPLMSAERFSKVSGVEIGVLTGWINRGYIQTIKIGKRRLINIASMTKDYSSHE